MIYNKYRENMANQLTNKSTSENKFRELFMRVPLPVDFFPGLEKQDNMRGE
jgi:hypothetical protein